MNFVKFRIFIITSKKSFELKNIFILLFCSPFLFPLLCKSQESLPLQEEVLSKIIRNINQYPVEENFENLFKDIFEPKYILQSAIPPFLKGKFETSEEFVTFAKTSLLTDVSSECGSHLDELVNQLRGVISDGSTTSVPATWVIQMVDAWGNFPAGILSGHTQIPGDFSECIQIRGNYTNPNKASGATSNFKGMYCSTLLVPVAPSPPNLSTRTQNSVNAKTKNGLRESVSPEEFFANIIHSVRGVTLFPVIGTCFPSSCTKQDVQTVFINFYKKTFNGTLTQIVRSCFTDDKKEFDAADIAVIALLSLIGFLCLAGSFYDIAVFRPRQNGKSDSKKSKSTVDQLLLAFSVPLNTESWLSTNVGRDNLTCLHGMRFLSISWVILGHTWEMLGYQFTWNLIDLQNQYRPFMNQVITNGQVQVDTFFIMSAALLSYHLLRELERRKGTFNYPLMVLHRYLRLTPTYAVMIAVIATILPRFASDPMSDILVGESETCRKNWWYNLLYINNFQSKFADICYGPSWYLANDMQFFILAPLIIYPLWRWRKAGFGILIVFSVASVVTPAVIQHIKKLPPSNNPFIDPKTYGKDLYYSPWCRMGPYLAGIFLGYVLYYKSKNPKRFTKIPMLAVAVGWILSTVTAISIVFGAQSFLDPANAEWTYTSVNSAFYSGLHRFAWGGVISWIIFACVSGYGGFVSSFLSWKVFMPLGRLTFCMYISSYPVQQIYHMTQVHPVHYSAYAQTNIFFAHMVMTCLVGFIMTVTIEAPFNQLEKILVPQKKPLQAKANPVPEPELPHTVNTHTE